MKLKIIDVKFKTSWILQISNILIGATGMFCIAAGAWYLVKNDTTAAIAGVGCGLVLLLFATVDRFEFIKGIGIEAKTKDLSKKIDDAEEILEKIKEITVAYTPSLISLASNSGRFTGPQPPDAVYALVKSARKLLSSAGESKAAIRAAQDPWITITTIDLTRALLHPLIEAGQQVEQDRSSKMASFGRPISTEASALIANLMALSNEVHLWLKDISDFGQCSPSQCRQKLIKIASNIPDYIDREIATTFRSNVEMWAPEIDYIDEQGDYRNASAWLKKVKDFHDGK